MGQKQSLKEQFKDFIVQWKKEQLTKKVLISKILFFLIGVIIVLITAIPMHVWAMNAPFKQYGQSSNFLWINIELNSGIAFSGLSNKTGLIYFLQSLMILVFLIILVFSKQWWYHILLGLATTGAMFNLIDRAIPKIVASLGNKTQYNVVLDYFQFFGASAIFNFPDVWILTGTIGLVVLNVIFSIIQTIKEKKQKQANEPKPQE